MNNQYLYHIRNTDYQRNVKYKLNNNNNILLLLTLV